jgi:glycosyltransferase involved in cell wall biosynthesis
MGHEVFVVAGYGRQNNLLRKGVRFIDMQVSDLMAPWQIASLVRFIRKNGIEIIHGHQRLPVFVGCMAARIAGIPFVVTVHGKTQYDVRLPLTRKWTDKFIFVRQSTLDEAPEYGIPDKKSVFIQNGVRIREDKGDRDPCSICYISRIDKRHAAVISLIMRKVLEPLAARWPSLTFNIVGDGEQLAGLRAEAEQLNRRLGRNYAIIHGYMPDVTEIVMRSGMVLGVGRVAMESLACAVPVLSVNQKYFGGMVSAENYDFFRRNNFVAYGLDEPDESKLHDSLEDYFSRKEYWQGEASVLQKKIAEDFDIVSITSSIADIYSELIRRRMRI